MALSAEFAELLQTEHLGRDVDLRAETASTMDDGHAAIAAGAVHGHLIVAEVQTAGRGSRGRTWMSPGAQLTFSLVLREVPVAGLTLAAGVAIAAALGRFTTTPRRIKWPNDVWLGDVDAERKVAGILVEARSSGAPRALVLGIGINLAPADWPEELCATSLADHASEFTTEAVLAAVLLELERAVATLRQQGVAEIATAVRQQLLWRGRSVCCDEVEGVLETMNADGSLVIETSDGPRTVRAGHLRLSTSK